MVIGANVAYYTDLSEEYPNEVRPFLDRDEIDESNLTSDQKSWRRNGALIKEKFLPDSLVDAYVALRKRVKSERGWTDPCPYLRHDEIMALALHPLLMDKMRELIGFPMGLHLNLTGWAPAQRGWSNNDFLNPELVYSHCAAVWIALEDINPDSGPLQYVPGSHRWSPLRKHKILSKSSNENAESPDWSRSTEGMIAMACENEIKAQGSVVETFLPKKGDVLFWHARLIHKNSMPNVPGTPRRALVSHYSSLFHRRDMPARRVYPKTGGVYFHFPDFEDKRHDECMLEPN